MSKHPRKLFLALFALVFAAGCGGGGGGSAPPAPPPPTGSLVTLTSDNATNVASVVAEQVLEDNIFGALATGIPIASSGSSAAADLVSLSAAPPGPGKFALTNSSLEQCDFGGTVDLTITVDDPLTISIGDEFIFQFTNCNDGTVILNGGLTMTVSGFQGDPSGDNFYLALGVELGAFQVNQDGDITGASGSVNIEIDSTMPPITTITVSTAALTTTHNGVTEVITNMSVTVVENDGTVPASVEVDTSFRISSPRLGGDVIVSTSVGLQSTGDGYPFLGEFRIEAANNAVIVVVALGGDMVRLEIDIDGDLTPDEVVDMTWDELLAASSS